MKVKQISAARQLGIDTSGLAKQFVTTFGEIGQRNPTLER